MEQSKAERWILMTAVVVLFIFLMAAPFLLAKIQTDYLLARPDAILVVADSVYNLSTICSVAPILLLGSIGVRLYRKRFVLRQHIKFVVVTLVVFVLSIAVPCAAMLSHYEVTQSGVDHYNAFASKDESIPWADIQGVQASMEYVIGATETNLAGNWRLFYLLELPSGQTLDLYSDGLAQDKLAAISQVDQIVRDQGIQAQRDPEDLDKFSYADESQKEMIYGLFES